MATLITATTIGTKGADAVTDMVTTAGWDACDADGNYVAYSSPQILAVYNGSGGNLTVSVNSRVNCGQGYDHDEPFTIANGKIGAINISDGRFNDSTTGYVTWNYASAPTDSKARVFKLT